ncbi:AmmeMemoRadiSam system protein A [uncultured Sphaerochaeta sp.]|uniref:AmmeMemoRadiSam system protein A n=1 Tax=uncultured Sphaerochaeta sp. TaxID=886478 RepID=UPI002A0A7416|nr:AmmeMemoRadiSam system protein A [uncultured Sphaerochaeta sp.]
MDTKEKALLLILARKTIGSALGEEQRENGIFLETPLPKSLEASHHGVFVTLKEKNSENRLRGCIGNIIGTKPLYKMVKELAIEAAFHDPRFPSVQIGELDNLTIEISVLTTPREIGSLDLFVPGRDGILLTLGFSRAVFLPQVATEQGWGKQEMLENLCLKAGLAPNSWQYPACRFETFQAIVFSEDDQ